MVSYKMEIIAGLKPHGSSVRNRESLLKHITVLIGFLVLSTILYQKEDWSSTNAIG